MRAAARFVTFACLLLVPAASACGGLAGDATHADGGASDGSSGGPDGSCASGACVSFVDAGGGTDAGSDASADVTAEAADDAGADAAQDALPDSTASSDPCAAPACGGSVRPLVLGLSSYPALASGDGGVNVTFAGYADPVCNSDSVIVAEVGVGTFIAFQGTAPDHCCPLQVYAHAFRDECFGRTYDFCGRPISSGDATPLQRLAACASDGGVSVWAP